MDAVDADPRGRRQQLGLLTEKRESDDTEVDKPAATAEGISVTRGRRVQGDLLWEWAVVVVQDKAVSDINVTPLIDVLLVLLIIFMVIVPVTPKGLDTLIPQPPKNKTQDQPNDRTIVVQVLANGKGEPSYKINETPSPSRARAQLAEIFATRQEKVMFVKGDADLDFGKVAEVIDMGHQAEVDNIGLITPRIARASKSSPRPLALSLRASGWERLSTASSDLAVDPGFTSGNAGGCYGHEQWQRHGQAVSEINVTPADRCSPGAPHHLYGDRSGHAEWAECSDPAAAEETSAPPWTTTIVVQVLASANGEPSYRINGTVSEVADRATSWPPSSPRGRRSHVREGGYLP